MKKKTLKCGFDKNLLVGAFDKNLLVSATKMRRKKLREWKSKENLRIGTLPTMSK